MPGLNTEEWREWVSYAERDRSEAEDAFSRGVWSEACFHAQQACEKLLKAFLLSKGVFVRVHDIGRLLDEASLFSPELRALRPSLEPLTIHYYAARYPNAARRLGVSYDEGVAEACLRAMRELWSALRPRLTP